MKNLINDLEKTMLEVQQMDREMNLTISNMIGDLKQQLFDKKNDNLFIYLRIYNTLVEW